MNTSQTTTDSSYDDIPYPMLTFSQTHPDLLATLARFCGLNSADPGACRVLEVGCGTGSNLLLMAHTLPASEFVGIDVSAVEIEIANAGADALGVGNVRFDRLDITTLDPCQLGEFDYIVAHGVYSWVPADVRRALLQIYSTCLAENGVGFISYNSYPGCHIRQMIWEPMRFHVSGIHGGLKKVEEGIKFLAALANSARPDSTYHALLWEELKTLVEKSAVVTCHDEFSLTNQPFYFHEFNSAAHGFGMKFLAEANPKWLNFVSLPPATQAFLDSLNEDLESREQYLDFIRCTRFRNALVCRNNMATRGRPDLEVFKNYFIAAELTAVSNDEKIDNDQPKRFIRPDGTNLAVDHPLTKAALAHLGKIFPRRIRFEELIGQVLRSHALENNFDEVKTTAECLADLYVAGYVRLHSYDPFCSYTVSERPIANSFSRWQVASGAESIAFLNQITIRPKVDIIRDLLSLLDGTKDHSQLVKEIKGRVTGIPKEQIEEFEKNTAEILKENLAAIANGGLLVR